MTTVVKEVLREVRTELIIGGEHRASSDGATFEVTDPATGKTFATVANGTVEDAVACVDAASAVAQVHSSQLVTAPRISGNIPK